MTSYSSTYLFVIRALVNITQILSELGRATWNYERDRVVFRLGHQLNFRDGVRICEYSH